MGLLFCFYALVDCCEYREILLKMTRVLHIIQHNAYTLTTLILCYQNNEGLECVEP